MKEQQLKEIYLEIANKELSFGCRYEDTVLGMKCENVIGEGFDTRDVINSEIIGHPILIGDVLDWMGDKSGKLFNDHFQELIFRYWMKKRLSIEEQSEDCIQYIYNLIKN